MSACAACGTLESSRLRTSDSRWAKKHTRRLQLVPSVQICSMASELKSRHVARGRGPADACSCMQSADVRRQCASAPTCVL